MNIKPEDKTIKQLLNNGCQFIIPRFQREYSWEKKNYKEFFEDMVNCLSVENGKLTGIPYFFGTMLFVSNSANGVKEKLSVVDGQQRLTTITIMFSALSRHFELLDDKIASNNIFKYVMAEDDDGEPVRILISDSHYPFFAYYIQDKDKKNTIAPTGEEEISLKQTYEYLYAQLDEKPLKKLLKKKHGDEIIDSLTHAYILKAIRDQILNLTLVSISTNSKTQANMIFENLNAKGKRLEHIDLIKNKLFETIKEVEPVDFAVDYWKKIRNVLNSEKENVGFATFYRHFWISKYKKSTSAKMYDDFNNTIKPKNDVRYREFMREMHSEVQRYMKIIKPKRQDYNNRKEYFWLVQSLDVLNNYFNIVQVRIALLALYDLKNTKIISNKIFKETILFLEGFHFAYNAIASGSPNRLEPIYSMFSIELRKCKDTKNANLIIDTKLIQPLNALLDSYFPNFEIFLSKFAKLTYSKKNNPDNMKVKYIINKLNCLYQNNELFQDDGSIEHITPEIDDKISLNIGNLILFEQNLNNTDSKSLSYENKISIYKKSKYLWIHDFIQENKTWTNDMIVDRAKKLAETYYVEILKRSI